MCMCMCICACACAYVHAHMCMRMRMRMRTHRRLVHSPRSKLQPPSLQPYSASSAQESAANKKRECGSGLAGNTGGLGRLMPKSRKMRLTESRKLKQVDELARMLVCI